MKINDIIFPHDAAAFLRRCMLNDSGIHATDQAIVEECAAASSNVEEFIDAYLAHESERGTQFWQELVNRERPGLRWKAIRADFGDRCFKTSSDAGSVRVGNGSFFIMVPNFRGDGETRVAIFDKSREFRSESLMYHLTMIGGEAFGIYGYDCGGPIVERLDGCYNVYAYDGLVAFVAAH